MRSTNEKLEQQTEKLREVDDTLESMDEELNRASALLFDFIRRLYTDKIIIAFTCLIFVGILGIVIYASVSKNDPFSVPDEAQPPQDVVNQAQGVVDASEGSGEEGPTL